MENFRKEVKEMPTSDIMLILDDQFELYSEEEIKVLKDELKSRPSNALELEEKERERKEIAHSLEVKAKRIKEEKDKKIDNLIKMGFDGYYEYKVVSLYDNSSGDVNPSNIEKTLNELGMHGWHLKCAYANELGHNSNSGRIGPFSSGTNATVDQNILIFERFVKIKTV